VRSNPIKARHAAHNINWSRDMNATKSASSQHNETITRYLIDWKKENSEFDDDER